jgi:hypothetical protein
MSKLLDVLACGELEELGDMGMKFSTSKLLEALFFWSHSLSLESVDKDILSWKVTDDSGHFHWC